MIRFAEVMLWLSLAVIVTWAAYALAEPIYLHACSRTTCTTGAGAADSDLMVYNIQIISNSKECPDKCSYVDYGAGQAHVMGHWLDIGCRAWGGSLCMWDRKAYPGSKIKELTEDRYDE